MKPKDALIKDGTVPTKAGKGRLSQAQIDRCKELAAKGWQIDGYTVTKSTESDTPAVVTKSATVSSDKIVHEIGPERYIEAEWVAYVHEDGKQREIGMRTVCNTCGASLTYHVCESPRVWVDYDREAVVNFKPRTNPLPAKRFF